MLGEESGEREKMRELFTIIQESTKVDEARSLYSLARHLLPAETWESIRYKMILKIK
jgi:hypothetical protein